jgi:hypothetical protein
VAAVDNKVFGWNTWLDFAEYELEHGLGPKFDKYFSTVESRLERYIAVGDSHVWEPHVIPQVNDRIRVGRIIHLVRNGILNVHALSIVNAELFEESTLIRRQIDRYKELFGGECVTAWEYWCYCWSLNSVIPDWLETNLPNTPVDIFRLEDLTADTGQLEQILVSLVPDKMGKISGLKRIQEKNDDRDLTGKRSPQDIWDGWTAEQREVFKRMCGSTMEKYGYEFP